MKILLLLLLSFSVNAKRIAPAKIPPLQVKKGTVHQVFKRSNQGYVVYLKKKDLSGQTLWKTQLYSKVYDKNVETDVQDTWLRNLTLTQDGIIAVDEMGKTYQIDPIDGALVRPVAPVKY